MCGKVCTPGCKILASFQRSSRLDVEKNYRVEFAHRQRWGRVLWPAALSPQEMSQPTYLLYLGNTQILPTKQIPSNEAVAQRAVVPSRGDRTMKKLLVLLAVMVLATSMSGCTSCTECANFATCNCCKRLRDWCFRGAHCNQNMAAMAAPVYAAPAATYAAGPPQAVAAPVPVVAAPPAMMPQQVPVMVPQQVVMPQQCVPQQCVPYVINGCQTCYPSGCCPPCYECSPCGGDPCGGAPCGGGPSGCGPSVFYDSGSPVGCNCPSGMTNSEVGTVYEGAPAAAPLTNELDPTPIDE